jgi:2-keto-3-deoxy-L-fuconate dehydrogenase
MRLENRVAIVTGGGSGIGQAAALRLAREGASVAVIDRDGAAAEATAEMLRAEGGAALARCSDVGQPGAAEDDARAVRDWRGRIDVLLTAAGFSCGGTVTSTDPADWAAVFRTNVDGTWLWARAVIPTMQQQRRGAIVTVASQLALAGGRNNSAYIAAKGAILSLTRTMALDYAADGIRVNAVVPGAVETPLLARSFARQADPAAMREASRRRHPLQRFGRPEELAEAVLYLASDASSFTTGTALAVDGGWLAG